MNSVKLFMSLVFAAALTGCASADNAADKETSVSKQVAIAVIKEAIRTGQASRLDEKAMVDLDAFVQKKMYDPVYVPLIEKRT